MSDKHKTLNETNKPTERIIVRTPLDAQRKILSKLINKEDVEVPYDEPDMELSGYRNDVIRNVPVGSGNFHAYRNQRRDTHIRNLHFQKERDKDVLREIFLEKEIENAKRDQQIRQKKREKRLRKKKNANIRVKAGKRKNDSSPEKIPKGNSEKINSDDGSDIGEEILNILKELEPE